jgi:hypothetical protein
VWGDLQAGGILFRTIDIAEPEVLIGGLLGVMMVFYFTGLAVAAVGTTAGEVVNEVRRQFKQNPGIMEYKSKPDYKSCVALVGASPSPPPSSPRPPVLLRLWFVQRPRVLHGVQRVCAHTRTLARAPSPGHLTCFCLRCSTCGPHPLLHPILFSPPPPRHTHHLTPGDRGCAEGDAVPWHPGCGHARVCGPLLPVCGRGDGQAHAGR